MTYIWHMNDARLTLRLSSDAKARIERAARASGFSSVSDYIVSSTLRAADEAILRSDRLVISELAMAALLQAQASEPQANTPELQAALSKYEEFVLRHG
jgi:uncharacterized protein (DUF1778 family)